jgi:hypothetical protein
LMSPSFCTLLLIFKLKIFLLHATVYSYVIRKNFLSFYLLFKNNKLYSKAA